MASLNGLILLIYNTPNSLNIFLQFEPRRSKSNKNIVYVTFLLTKKNVIIRITIAFFIRSPIIKLKLVSN